MITITTTEFNAHFEYQTSSMKESAVVSPQRGSVLPYLSGNRLIFKLPGGTELSDSIGNVTCNNVEVTRENYNEALAGLFFLG